MIIDPSGKTLHMDAMLAFFQKLPFADVLFQNFLFSAFARPLPVLHQGEKTSGCLNGNRELFLYYSLFD